MATPKELWRFAKELKDETRHSIQHLATHTARSKWQLRHARLRQAEAGALRPSEGGVLSEDEVIQELVKLGRVPDDFYHNAGSPDYMRHERRFDHVLKKKWITGTEKDSLYYPPIPVLRDKFYAGHGLGFFIHEAIRRPSVVRRHALSNLVQETGNCVSRVNFDIKFSRPETAQEFFAVLDQVPPDIQIFLSGVNWEAMQYFLDHYTKRNLTVLFTVDGVGNESTTNFRKMCEKGINTQNHRIGVSLRKELASREFMDYLKANNCYSLLYPIDTREELLRAARIGVSGITSNNREVLYIAEQTRQKLAA